MSQNDLKKVLCGSFSAICIPQNADAVSNSQERKSYETNDSVVPPASIAVDSQLLGHLRVNER